MKLKMRPFLFTAVMCSAVAFGAEAQAATLNWNVPAGAYGDAANWDLGVVPISGDKMAITNGGTATLSTAQAIDLLDFRITGNSTLLVEAGGKVGSSGWSFLGKNGTAGDTGTMTINGGEVIIDRTPLDPSGDSNFVVGREARGILNVNGGLLSIDGSLLIDDKGKDGGEVYLNGGMIVAGGFDMAKHANTDALMDITGGVMKVSGDIRAHIDAQVAAGNLTGYGTAAAVHRHYDATFNTTHVWAVIPEPTSLMLFGLAGSLLAVGRRK